MIAGSRPKSSKRIDELMEQVRSQMHSDLGSQVVNNNIYIKQTFKIIFDGKIWLNEFFLDLLDGKPSSSLSRTTSDSRDVKEKLKVKSSIDHIITKASDSSTSRLEQMNTPSTSEKLASKLSDSKPSMSTERSKNRRKFNYCSHVYDIHFQPKGKKYLW